MSGAAPVRTPAPDAFYAGRLLHHGECRQRAIDAEGHMVPVVSLDLETDTPLRMPIHIEILFPVNMADAARQRAAQYRKGAMVEVRASVLSHRLSVIASEIRVLAAADAASANPTTQPVPNPQHSFEEFTHAPAP